jgi:hypothetical protein
VKVLLDENLPHKLRAEIVGHEFFTAAYMGWSGIENGELLALAAKEGFDVLLTNDRGLEYEQNPALLPIGVIVLLIRSNVIESIRPLLPNVHRVLQSIRRGELVKVTA